MNKSSRAKRAVRRWLAVCAAVSALAATPAIAVTAEPGVEQPRAFGHNIGDVLEQTLHVEVPAGTSIDPASLPRRGRVDRWFSRLALEVTPQRGDVTRIHLRYQVINAPLEVRTVTLPAITLRLVETKALQAARQALADSGRRDEDPDAPPAVELPATATASFEAWPVTIGPMTPETVLARAGLDLFQPDRDLQAADGRLAAMRTALAAGALALLWFAPALLRFTRSMGRRPPFQRAARSIERLHRGTGDAGARFRDALREFHRALDSAHGERVFAADVDALIDRQPRLSPVREPLQWFFGRSRAMFFAGADGGLGSGAPVGDGDWQALLDLCRQCRRLERKA